MAVGFPRPAPIDVSGLIVSYILKCLPRVVDYSTFTTRWAADWITLYSPYPHTDTYTHISIVNRCTRRCCCFFLLFLAATNNLDKAIIDHTTTKGVMLLMDKGGPGSSARLKAVNLKESVAHRHRPSGRTRAGSFKQLKLITGQCVLHTKGIFTLFPNEAETGQNTENRVNKQKSNRQKQTESR